MIFNQTELVKTGSLKPYDKNPRKGDVRAIAESLAAHGQFKPIVVQKSTRKILAGNHTWQAAQTLGWDEIAAVVIDVDDEQAAKIVLADNRTSELGDFDYEALAELLQDIEDTVGTGYSESDLEALLSSVEEAQEEVEAQYEDEQGEAALDFDDEPDEFDGVFTLRDDVVFSSSNLWEIPDLLPEMLIEELPQPLTTWAGSATRDMEWDGYWLWNFRVDSTAGMKDLSKVVMSFYTYDYYFGCWWDNPTKYLAQMMSAGIQYAISPNFSQEEIPKTLSLFALYKSRWLARYFQEIGVRVMPDLEMRPEQHFVDLAVDSLPDNLPWAAVQVQNLVGKLTKGKAEVPEERAAWVKRHLDIVRRKSVQNLLVYSDPSRYDEVREWFAPVDVNIEFLPSRLYLLSKRWKDKQEKGEL